MDPKIAAAALAVAICSLLVSFTSLLLSLFIWRRSHRPIVTAAVKTHKADSQSIEYDLVILNSGTIPAKNIQIRAEENSLAAALGPAASAQFKEKWLAAFVREILILQNNDRVSCSFGYTTANGGFWKHDAIITIVIKYKGWFGKKYEDKHPIQIADSDSFTGYQWG